jgi:ABC-type phosphate transport system substrate-binding protein
MRYSARLIVAALFAFSPAYPPARAIASPVSLLAQTPTFERPDTLPAGTTLSIQSSPNMGMTAQELQKQFVATYEGTDVSVDVASSDDAIASLINGDIDLAAIGRPLTSTEQNQGLTVVPLDREKIAVIIGPDNPFRGNLTFEQFAAMFRGEITDWSEVGGEPGPIRFVDRPELSDTRRSLSQYEVFRTAPFELGATGEPVTEDDTATVIQALGNDGISYAIAPHVLERDGVTIVPMHDTLPDDPRYPYSQPRYFVFKDAATPAVAAFLGFATSPDGTAALAAARQSEAAAVTTGLAGATTTATAETATADGEEAAAPPTDAETPDDSTADSPEGTAEPDLNGAEAAAGEGAAGAGDTAAAAGADTDNDGGAAWLWWLLPIAGLGALAWLFTRGKGGSPTVEHGAPAAGTAPPLDNPPGPAATPDTSSVGTSAIPAPESAAAGPEAPPLAPASAPQEITSSSLDDVTPPPVAPDINNGSAPTPEPPAISDLPAGASASNNSGVTPPTAPDSPTVPDVAPTPMSGSAISAAAGAAGLAAGAAASLASTEDQSAIEASKYNVVGRPTDGDIDLSGLDDGLPPLPDGYGESRIVLMPRDPQWAYAYWDTPSSHKEELRRQGGERLALRLYDVTDVDLAHQAPHSMQQFDCDELAREWYMQIPVSDRDYRVEIGYLAGDGRWLVLATSNTVRIPPVYPSDWTDEHFMTVAWEESLQGKTLMTLVDPRFVSTEDAAMHDHMFALSQASELQRVSGSIFGSMQHVPGSMVPQQAISSYVFPSGVGMGLAPGAVVPPGFNVSGLNMSGLNMSGVGFFASAPPIRPRKFWLVADAELIVYGATEPDASVTVGGNPIQLSPDGTFRFQTAFPDGQIDYPIMGVAADGEQSRSIHMTFERRTPERRTNTKEEAQEEWPED